MIMRLFLPNLIFTVKIENLVEINESLQSSIIPSPDDLEIISVSITHRETIILCTIILYIPPNSDSDYLKFLLLHLSNLFISHDHIILVGDFNLPDVDWNTLTGTSLSSKKFCDCVSE